jgi:protein-tyrosine phosphatase
MIDVNTFISSHTQIIPGLWIGNEASSQDGNFIRKNNISFIINCTNSIANKFEKDIRYMRLPVNDPGPLRSPRIANPDNVKMISLIPRAARALNDALVQGENVLVHCHAGAQRSASVVIYYLIKYGNFAVSEAFKNALEPEKKRILYRSSVNYVTSKRPIVYFGGSHNNFSYAFEHLLR